MKKLVLFLITLYQGVFSVLLHQLLGIQRGCRYEITCSEYAKKKIQEYGIIRGGKMSIKRLLSCHPFARNTYV